jgi:hypothetical protein
MVYKKYEKGVSEMRLNWSKFAFKLIWVIGLFGMVLVGFHYEQIIKHYVVTTFNTLPRFWFNSTVPFLFGVYISILFVKVWSIKINLPLFLCLTIPCLIISFYSPVIYTIVSNTTSTPSSFSVPIPFWMIKINYFGIAPIVAGLTLIVGLLGDSQQSKN